MIILSAGVCGTAIFLYYVKEKYDYTVRRLPPGPTSIPFIGNALSIDMKMPHLSLLEMAKKYGDVFSLKLGTERVVILNSTETIKEAYKGVDLASRPKLYSMDLLVGDKGFLTCSDQKQWRIHTRFCKNAIRLVNDTNLASKVTDELRDLVNQFMNYQGQPFDPKEDLNLASLNVICNMVFGERYKRGDAELDEILDYTAEIMKVISPVHPVNSMPWLRHFPNKWFDALLSARNKRDRILMKKYLEHVATYQDGEIRDMLDAFVQAAKQAVEEKDDEAVSVLTPDHTIINMWLIFFAGTDTVMNTLLWALLYMAVFPKVQTKLQEELDRNVGKERCLVMEDTKHLPYLTATIYEILRYSSMAVLGVPHAAAMDTEVMGYHIPKGTQVLANFWAVHHDESAWEKPNDFMPERFLDENGKMRHLSEFTHFMPFSTGRRMCIGKGVAKTELFLILGGLLQQFWFELPPGEVGNLEGETVLSLIPKPYRLVTKKRVSCTSSQITGMDNVTTTAASGQAFPAGEPLCNSSEDD